MTEQEWLACTDPRTMFEKFGGVHGKMRLDPRLRRFAVECCRRVRHLITDAVFRTAADAGEAFADDPRNEKQRFQQWQKRQSKAIEGALSAVLIDTTFMWQMRQSLLVVLLIGKPLSTPCERLHRH